jgi:futalosine hydrolase
MKKLIVTAATAMEIEPFVQFLQANFQLVAPNTFQNKEYSIHILISGVGMMSSAFSLATAFAVHEFDYALQAGIAGAFDTALQLGDVVAVQSEQYGDLGAEDKEDYIDIFELGFLDKNTLPFTNGRLLNENPSFAGKALPLVNALSVNTVSGKTSSIDARRSRYNCKLESMEGIAFHYVCLQHQIPFVQIRAISNYVTPRNKAEWKLKLAIDNLNQYLIETFSTK